ncbi:16S rRNA (cytosine(967)-C(5))-methyltransferase RsmB [Enterococcus olivae]
MKKNTKKTVRYVALRALERIDQGGAYSNLLLRELIEKSRLSDKDSRLLTELVYGTLSRQRLLAFYIQPSIVKAKKVDDWVKLLLELSLYQLLYLDKVPSHAVLNEAVEIAKARGNEGIGKFVNGVLRNIQRQGVPSLETIKDPIERLSREISLPKFLTKKLVAEIGEEETRKLGLSLFEPSHISCRVDTRKITREKVLEILEEEGIEARKSEVSPYGIIADRGYIAGSSLFTYGLITIQDESSMLVAPALQIEADHKVLDACAAPGGKTTHIATFLDPAVGGKVTALDIHAHKTALIEENAKRLQVVDVVETRTLDAREAGTAFAEESFDRILVDAPCSGMGLMRRKPDIRYNKKPEDFQKLPVIQLDILESVAPALKPGGLLVYSTCTFAPEENQEVVAAFLERHSDFSLVEVPVGNVVQSSIEKNMLTIYPQQYMTDGFFISCLRKK